MRRCSLRGRFCFCIQLSTLCGVGCKRPLCCEQGAKGRLVGTKALLTPVTPAQACRVQRRTARAQGGLKDAARESAACLHLGSKEVHAPRVAVGLLQQLAAGRQEAERVEQG